MANEHLMYLLYSPFQFIINKRIFTYNTTGHVTGGFSIQDLAAYRIARLTVPCPAYKKLVTENFNTVDPRYLDLEYLK